jgi:HAD superfamily hydrolase (TIGR01549 family)
MEALVADVDGTYIDTLGFIYQAHYDAAVNFLVDKLVGMDTHITFDEYADALKKFFHFSPKKRSEETLKSFFTSNPELINGMDFEVLNDMLLASELQIAEKSIKPYPDLDPTLRRIGETGIKHAIWTSASRFQVVRSFGIALPEMGLQELHKDENRDDETKVKILTKAIAKTYGIPDFMVVTIDDTEGKDKPDPEGFKIAMAALDAEPNKSIMLGDHANDMQAAKAAGAGMRIGITHGVHDGQVLKANGATETIDSLEELSSLL